MVVEFPEERLHRAREGESFNALFGARVCRQCCTSLAAATCAPEFE